jgi:protein TonB
MVVERSRTPTANAAFKARYRKTLDVALSISLAAHLLAFALIPRIELPRASPRPPELELVEIEAPPEIEIPPPPEEIERPRIPIEEPSLDVEEETTEETEPKAADLPEAPPPPVPPPPAPGGAEEWLSFDKPPKPRRMPFGDADYPAVARASGIEGTVLLKVTVDEEGRVAGVVVLRSDSPIFDEAAVRVVRRWEFAPAERDGVPVRSTITVPLRFTLER